MVYSLDTRARFAKNSNFYLKTYKRHIYGKWVLYQIVEDP